LTQPTVTLTKGGSAKAFAEGLKNISKLEVLVGIPAEKASRKGDKINNAELMYVLTHGSPLRHIPATPIIEPAIELKKNRDPISAELSEAAKSMLDGKRDATITHLKRAGLTGQNAVRAYFTDPANGWPANAESTIQRKLAKLKGKKRKAALAQIEAQGGDTTGVVTRNIDTAQLRSAVTYVVKAE
jgi:hypothetical protein